MSYSILILVEASTYIKDHHLPSLMVQTTFWYDNLLTFYESLKCEWIKIVTNRKKGVKKKKKKRKQYLLEIYASVILFCK